MLRLIYSFGIRLYFLVARVYAQFSGKAKAFVSGREHIWSDLDKIPKDSKTLWFHCASLGEFEQMRPVMEMFKSERPDHFFLLTFYSPSGYSIRKEYPGADLVTYIPIDLVHNAERFLKIVNPELTVFVKYEFWFNFLNEFRKQQKAIYLISGIFRPDQHFFKWYGSWQRKHLGIFNHFFVQDDESVKLLESIGIRSATRAGDTRFDRVSELRKSESQKEKIDIDMQEGPLLIAGSTWPEDESLLKELLEAHPSLRMVIAPHEISESHLGNLKALFHNTGSFALLSENKKDSRVLVIDKIGLLSRLYSFGDMAYIGGGFGKGIHNTLEAATWGIPVIFGPNYNKFNEASELISSGSAKSFHTAQELINTVGNWIENPDLRIEAGQSAAAYVDENAGATPKIGKFLISELNS